eukprot:TRINITY_DN61811_c0_g1_i1.p1 TRINITY_DN61811_c0_g1~~TRINITY_DN61811_c0_g1_i1.p1  ORF type:complete len:440 (-),score=67.44 TRINITY_DN61811_c0_g1_i1:56-1375(-)
MSPPGPWAEGFGNFFALIGTVMSFVFLLSAAPVLLEIKRRGSTGVYRFAPYLFQWINCATWVVHCLHAGVFEVPVVFLCSFCGLAASSLFLFVYAQYITEPLIRRNFFRVVPGCAIVFGILAFLSFSVFPIIEAKEKWTWWKSLCVVTNCLVMSGPTVALAEAWRRKRADLVPLKLGYGSLLIASPWVAYALCVGDAVVLWPNLLGLALSVLLVLAHNSIMTSNKNAGTPEQELSLQGRELGGGASDSLAAPHWERREYALVQDPWKQALYSYGFMDAPKGGGLAFLKSLRRGAEVEMREPGLRLPVPPWATRNAVSPGPEVELTSSVRGPRVWLETELGDLEDLEASYNFDWSVSKAIASADSPPSANGTASSSITSSPERPGLKGADEAAGGRGAAQVTEVASTAEASAPEAAVTIQSQQPTSSKLASHAKPPMMAE